MIGFEIHGDRLMLSGSPGTWLGGGCIDLIILEVC